jgi:hypothetical protein
MGIISHVIPSSHHHPTTHYLQSIPEALKALNDLATTVSALVGEPELEIEQQSCDDDESGGDHASSDARNVVRSILGAEDGASDDATDTASAD